MNSFLVNPYEGLGILHNKGMDYVVEKLPPERDIYQIIRIISEYVCSLFKPDGKFSEIEVLNISQIISYSVNNLNNIQTVYKDGQLNDRQIFLLEKIVSVNNAYLKLEEQYESFCQMEFEVFSDPMPYKEKEILLIATAVGKHSAKYWTEVINNPKHAWNKWLPNVHQPRYLLGKEKWPKEDAKGAVSGAIGGAVGGISGGIGGVVLGATLGAVGGGIGASVASAIFD